MIEIANKPIDINNFVNPSSPENSIEKKTLTILSKSSSTYNYDNENHLKFELLMRKSIVAAALDLHHSHISFKVFRKSKCNSDFWNRTNEGGFISINGNSTFEAVKDIYVHSSQYGTECSTAMVIVYLKSLTDIFPEELFNKLFPEIYLMNWQHLDPDLGIIDFSNLSDYLPGDGRYFKNPDVNPLTPEWQGENVFDLGDGYFYGHGIGKETADGMIKELNKNRTRDSNESAYLMDSAKRQNFKSLAQKFYGFM
jgi:protein-glutamine gamma-glutamyltransferase